MGNGIVVVGRVERMGLGTMTHEFCEAFYPDRLIVIDCLNGRKVDPSGYKCGEAKVVTRAEWNNTLYAAHLMGTDAKVCVGFETWYNDSIPAMCRGNGVKSVMFPMHEWSSPEQCRQSDLLLALSGTDYDWCLNLPQNSPCSLRRCDWPASPFVRQKCERCHGGGKGQPVATGFESAGRINEWCMSQPCGRCNGTGFHRELSWPPKTFVHLAGNSSHNREGTREVLLAAHYLEGTGARLRVHSSFPLTSFPHWEDVDWAGPTENRADLFAGCDCLVQPRRLPGHSLPINEATGEGIPCVVLDIPDFKHYPYRVKAIPDGQFRARGLHDCWRADVDELGDKMRSMALGRAAGHPNGYTHPKLPTWAEFKAQWEGWTR
jgi:hypothetical protein